MTSSSGIRRVANHMVVAAAALKEIATAMDIAEPTGLASGIKLPSVLPTALAPITPRTAPAAITNAYHNISAELFETSSRIDTNLKNATITFCQRDAKT